jgi:hypothetical protein
MANGFTGNIFWEKDVWRNLNKNRLAKCSSNKTKQICRGFSRRKGTGKYSKKEGLPGQTGALF